MNSGLSVARYLLRGLLVCSALPVYAGALSVLKSEPEEKWVEEEVKQLPPFPSPSSLVSFVVQGPSKYNYRVDRPSVSVGKDGVVRFVLAIEASGAGAQVSYAGIHCQTKRWKSYAIGTAGNSWRKPSKSAWEVIERKSLENYREELYRTYFCSGRGPAGDEKSLLANLRKVPSRTFYR